MEPRKLQCVSKQWSCQTFTAGVEFVEREADGELLELEAQELERQIEECSITCIYINNNLYIT